ncbi:hypothetical protein M427DRAFT_32502 [Gonapodya prolifera JEL478]|uniref:Protein kinase domain-containing protein n=1 Tax=Gonapodya prolifera (strain JEL478) TaxID=1344416 RepID=A0A139AF29_GONPJ|nr:hypothetical protein M427DRAFT_32502 [Gonapodya prolifera JEL478]|eukprot:KXS15289.1 hypothetical protein M427DRAFT_32502 [Gonapodya prolifera JEL478]
MPASLQTARVPEFWEVDTKEVEWTTERLGRGGFGTIPVALKLVVLSESQAILGVSTSGDGSAAPAADSSDGARLECVGNDVNGRPFFISPIMENGNVEQYLARLKGSPTYHEEVFGLPGNVLVTAEMRGAVTDLGFAQITGGDESIVLPGSMMYLPPERLGHALGIGTAEHAYTKAGDVTLSES